MNHVTLLSTYPPRTCGIATFASHLRTGLLEQCVQRVDVVALVSSSSREDYSEEVVVKIREDEVQDYVAAAEVINASDTELVNIQHEFGIFGGPEGLYLTDFLTRLDKPVVTSLHTVLPDPSLPYRRALEVVARLSDHLVVMTGASKRLLRDVYRVDPEKVHVIPHGVPTLPFTAPDGHKSELGLGGRTILLTFGLLSPGKGIEFVLNALPDLVKADSTLLYVVLGATHPEVLRRRGEAYRDELVDRVGRLGIQEHVRFVDRYVQEEELLKYLQACDIYITPYPGRDQASSGTLAYAVGAGKAVVSTPYLYAEELLADGHGRLVPYGDTKTLTSTLRHLIRDETDRVELAKRAYARGQTMTWPKVGQQYRELFERGERPRGSMDRRSQPALPRISLDHLLALSDDTGLFQHAPYGVPDRTHGYCTDDVGRALLVVLRYHQRTGAATVRPLIQTYLSFLHHAQKDDGGFSNFLSFDRQFIDAAPSEDTVGRALWGLGVAATLAPDRRERQLARQMIEKAREVPLHHPRALAYSICGLAQFLRGHSGATQSRRRLVERAEQLVAHYRAARTPRWPWFHDALTYGNGILPLALLEAFRVTGQAEYETVALETLNFLLDVTYHDHRFDFVGNEGWYPRDGNQATFAQQSIEAGYMAEACTVAFEVTGDSQYQDRARAAVDWFSGRNRLGIRLYDPKTGACADGLERYGASFNQGAESVIACLLGLLAVGAPTNEPFASDHLAGVTLRRPFLRFVSTSRAHYASSVPG